MKLFSFSLNKEEVGIGVETPNGIFNLTRAFDIYQRAKGVRKPVSFAFLQVMVEMGYCSGKTIKNIFLAPWVQSKQEELKIPSGFRYELPIARPSKIIGLARNYKAHAQELNQKLFEEPVFFSKAPSALVPHETHIVIPKWLENRVDHEAEMALVIGKTGKYIAESEAMSFIAGYTILNDVTARDMQKQDIDRANPWFRAKSFDTFCPVGPMLVPADEIENPNDLEIHLYVNGEERQRAKTSSMIFKVPEIVSYLSRQMTLHPGDIIATGTPEGVSPIKHGDEIEITITDLGTLRNQVVKEA